MLLVKLDEVWRDKILIESIKSEIKRQAINNWRPWEIYLPPELLWPMLEEVSQGMYQQWSPTLFGVGVQVGEPHEVSIKFVLPDLNPSPVNISAMPYYPSKASDIAPIEVTNHGNKV